MTFNLDAAGTFVAVGLLVSVSLFFIVVIFTLLWMETHPLVPVVIVTVAAILFIVGGLSTPVQAKWRSSGEIYAERILSYHERMGHDGYRPFSLVCIGYRSRCNSW